MMRYLKSLGKKGARRLGIDVRGIQHTEEGVLSMLLARLQPAVVLDVGANIGQYAHKLRVAGYRGRIISFEALESAHRTLVQAASSDPAWEIAPRAAIGSHEGTVEINVTANTASSSVLPSTALLSQAAPQAEYVGKQSCRSMRLDAYAGIPVGGRVFLKIDVQGFEMEVLRGASELLPRLCAIQLELSLVPLYQGAPVMTEVIRYLDERGFDLFQLLPGFRDERDGRLLQAEGYFVPRSTSTA
jgi:FkbM family methyltransferase